MRGNVLEQLDAGVDDSVKSIRDIAENSATADDIVATDGPWAYNVYQSSVGADQPFTYQGGTKSSIYSLDKLSSTEAMVGIVYVRFHVIQAIAQNVLVGYRCVEFPITAGDRLSVEPRSASCPDAIVDAMGTAEQMPLEDQSAD